ncbi:hypothetical protein [Serratia marcescens]|uniref:hypothetical protein n=1 Tax=Serratia marcescens TaxID=615 RepID=UPI00235EA8B8|nr:hypothetical protein [Serratia marcescens]
MSKLITAVEPQRDQYGYWTHPDYFVPANGAEYGVPGEFEAWKEANRVTGALQWMENHASAEQIDSYESGDGDISGWEPTPPAGDGWFIASIHDTEDGPVCYWLQPVEKDPDALRNLIEKHHTEALKREFIDAHQACEKAAYAYFCACELGEERSNAGEIYQRIRLATRRGAILSAPHGPEPDPIDVFVAQVCGDLSAGHQR